MNDHAQWCLAQYRLLKEGGVWAVPRSGLVFQKFDGGFRLLEKMPYQRGMPVSKDELDRYQDEDFEAIRDHFAAVGLEVTR